MVMMLVIGGVRVTMIELVAAGHHRILGAAVRRAAAAHRVRRREDGERGDVGGARREAHRARRRNGCRVAVDRLVRTRILVVHGARALVASLQTNFCEARRLATFAHCRG